MSKDRLPHLKPKVVLRILFSLGFSAYNQSGSHNQFKSSYLKTIIIFHGNGETAKDYLDTYVNLLENYEINILLAEYRGYGGSTGNCNLINCLSDALNIYNFLKLSPENTIVLGRSFGAIPAIHLASKFNTQGLIVDNGIFDTLQWLIPIVNLDRMERGGLSFSYTTFNSEDLEAEILEHLNNDLKIESYTGSIQIFHSENERDFIPIEHADKLRNRATQAKFIGFEKLIKGYHNDSFSLNKEEYQMALKHFFMQIDVPQIK